MRDPKRIDRIMTKLKCYWMKHPDLRLGQIVSNALGDCDVFYQEDEVLELWLAKELQQGKDANNAMKDLKRDIETLRRDRGTDGWVVDYKTLERITVKACQIEPVAIEDTEAVILALVDEHFARLEDE